MLAGAANELGGEVTRQLTTRGHRVIGWVETEKDADKVRKNGGTSEIVNFTDSASLDDRLRQTTPDVVMNLIPQHANTLLHDGHNWKNQDRQLPATTTALMAAVENVQIKYLVHASYAFLYGNMQNAVETTPLDVPSGDQAFNAARSTDEMAHRTKIPTCVLRLGYLYGPQAHDLLLYWKSFQNHRGYYAGKPDNLANFLHFEDAARALIRVAEGQPQTDVFNVTDGSPVWFGTLIDYFAQKLGFRKPLHIPVFILPVFRWVITRWQQKLLELSSTVNSDKFRAQFTWTPTYPSFSQGIDQTVETWHKNGTKP